MITQEVIIIIKDLHEFLEENGIESELVDQRIKTYDWFFFSIFEDWISVEFGWEEKEPKKIISVGDPKYKEKFLEHVTRWQHFQ